MKNAINFIFILRKELTGSGKKSMLIHEELYWIKEKIGGLLCS